MEHIKAKITLGGNTDIYEPRVIRFGDDCVIGCDNSRNMSFLLGYCSKEEAEKRKIPIAAQMEQYNDAVKKLWLVPGFKEHFAVCHSYMPIKDIEQLFGEEAASFARNICCIANCYPDLMVVRDALQLRGAEFEAAFEIDGNQYAFDVANSCVDAFTANGKICLFDWTDEDIDRTYALINQFQEDGVIAGDAVEYISQVSYYAFNDGCVQPKIGEAMQYCIKLLISRGYLKEYCLESVNFNDIWAHHTHRKDGTVLLTILSPAYKKDKLLCERLNCLWNALYVCDDENGWDETNLDLKVPFYFLQDEKDQTYISANKAALGGHKKLKIYGRLDCPSAHRYIEKGQYVQHRVFFKDEGTAIAAGYRPCGVCMKAAYIQWKKEMTKSSDATRR